MRETALLKVLVTVHMCCLSACGLDVQQRPDSVTVQERGDVTIYCSYNGSELGTVSVEWYVKPTDNVTITGLRYIQRNVTENTAKTDELLLRAVERNASGTYYCRVKQIIPRPLDDVDGTGTVLTVTVSNATRPKSPADKTHRVAATAVGTAAGILASVGVGCLTYRRCKVKGSNTTVSAEEQRETVVSELLYAEVVHLSGSGARGVAGGRAERQLKREAGPRDSVPQTLSPGPREEDKEVVYSVVHR
ncbi:uncharacterized protein LOC136712962 isoform X1 [Amia ocellicauda]|uniref:uncharacterized protein LOC136712962 isoform X1 n=1 Tax=Amia ocellicauda TaxID=2972642 RepID=UPI0034647ABB